jgi:RHS repeat-associated protein
LATLSVIPARNIESDLAVVRQRLAIQNPIRTNSTEWQRRAALAGAALSETSAALDRLTLASDPAEVSRSLAYLRQRLQVVAGGLEADFASVEARLRGLGLPEKVAAWRAFVRHYRARLAAVDAELGSLAAGAGGLSPAQRRDRLAALRAQVASGARTEVEETVRGAAQAASPPATSPQGSPRPASDDLPAPADLAENRVVLLTQEIRQKAAALGDPTALNNFVATQIEYVPYLGQMQNSLAVLLSGRGNAFDQATLLIALLRAARIPARYVFADVVMTREEVRDWMGVKEEAIVLGLLSTGLLPIFSQVGPSTVVAGHVWVEAYLDTSIGKGWFAMDPARKRRAYQPGIVLPRLPYDRMAYLKALRPVPPAEPYLDALRAELQRRFPGRGFHEVPYAGSLLPARPPSPQPPYPVVKLHFRAAEPPAEFRHRIRLSLSAYGGSTSYLSADLSLPEVVLQSLSLSFSPATKADLAVVEAFGGLENAPAAVVDLLPEFRLAGQVIGTGRTPLPTGTALDLSLTHLPVGQGNKQYVSRNLFTAGETAAVVLGANQVSEELLAGRISSFLERLPAASAAEATRRLLDLAALRYLHRLELDKQRLTDALQMRFFQAGGVENAITFASLEPQNLFDRPFVVTPGRLRIHANPTSLPLLDLNRSDQGPDLHIAWQLHNDASSVLEHEIWEELVLIPSVSTIKILQTAIRDNIPIRTVNRANAAAEIAAVEAAPSTKATMQQRVNAGATLTLPQRPVRIGAWTGLGWIEEYEDGWSFAYILDVSSRLSPGGDTGGTTPPPHPPGDDPGGTGTTDDTGGTACSDPVNVANGNLFEQALDLLLRSKGPTLGLARTYNSLALAAGPLGPGWRHNYQMALQDRGASVTLTTASGGVLSFSLVAGAYVSPPGSNLSLTKEAQGYLLRRKNGNQLRFEPNGQLRSITDRIGNSLAFSYDGGRLTRVADRAGRALTLSYDGPGRLTALQDFTGRRVAYDYDAAGRLVAVTGPAGNRTAYTYYSDPIYNHLLQSVTTPEGRVTQFQYYGNGRVARVTEPGGRRLTFLYLPLRQETHVVDQSGRLLTYQYNPRGNVVRVIRGDGTSTSSVYSQDGKLEARTDEAGYTTRFTYDAAGNLTSVTDPLGRAIRLDYEPVFHHLKSLQDARGNVTRFEYDAQGNLTRLEKPLGVETRFGWDANGNLTSVTDAEGSTTRLTYDALGNSTEVRDALGNVTRFEYDSLSRRIRAVDPLGGEARQSFDALDRVVQFVNRLGQSTTATYDREGRLIRGLDFAGRATSFRYDARNNLSQVTDALGQVTRYDFTTPDCGCTASANLAQFRDAAGYTRVQTYDSEDRLLATTDALGHTTRYAYDARGNIAKKTGPNGELTTFEYDAAGQLIRKAFADGTEARFAYDQAGNLVSASNQHVTLTHTYDELKRLTSVTDSRFQKTIRYSYNKLGKRTAMTDPEGGVTSYAYDANRRLAAVTSPSGAVVRLGRDPLGRISTIDYAGAASASFRYDDAGRIAELAYAQAGATTPWALFRYSYDAAGNATAVAGPDGSHIYQYDATNRLLRAHHDLAPAEVYTYDGAGNRTGSAADPAYRYDPAGRLLAAEGASFAYDRNGNLIRKTTANQTAPRARAGTTRYTWDPEDRLVRVDLPGGGDVAYKYDPFGRRIEKNANGVVTIWLYDGNDILLEMDVGGRRTARYTHGRGIDWPLAVERDARTWFYHADVLGSVVALSDSSGDALRLYAYDTWGRPRSTEPGGPANPYRFAGREYDAETGLYYLRARYYDPATGRFVSADPLDLSALLLTAQDEGAPLALLPASPLAAAGGIGLGLLRFPRQLNPYSYALNTPTTMRDPSGLKCGVMVHIGWSLQGDGIATADTTIQGVIDDFDGWLAKSQYTLEYSCGPFVEIRDFGNTGEIIGLVDVRDLPGKFQYQEEPPQFGSPEMWEEFRKMAAEAPELLGQWLRASYNKPWDQMTWSEWWQNVLGK